MAQAHASLSPALAAAPPTDALDADGCVYSLRNQTRTVHALAGDLVRSVFLVGTQGLTAPNELHVLLYDDDDANDDAGINANAHSASAVSTTTSAAAAAAAAAAAVSGVGLGAAGDAIGHGGYAGANASSSSSLYSMVFRHPYEIHALSSCHAPENANIIASSYNIVGETSARMRSTLWRLDHTLISQNFKASSGTTNLELEPILTIPDQNSASGTSEVIFDSSGSLTRLVGRESHALVIYSLADGLTAALEAATVRFDAATAYACWSPHSSPVVAVAHGPFISLVDLRRGAAVTSTQEGVANSLWMPTITSLDYNPSRPHIIAASADDGAIRIYDARHLANDKPMHVIASTQSMYTKLRAVRRANAPGAATAAATAAAAASARADSAVSYGSGPLHSFAVNRVQYNRYHDMLLLSGGADSNVLLHVYHHGIPPPVSTPYTMPSSPVHANAPVDPAGIPSSLSSPAYSPTHGGIAEGVTAMFNHHEDSVYSLAWSNASPWIFCSASYEGRVVIGNVPNDTKYKIIMS